VPDVLLVALDAAERPITAAVASTFSVRLTPASILPENVISADATPAASTSDVVVRRMRFMFFPRVAIQNKNTKPRNTLV
jgi:hypothetical protein